MKTTMTHRILSALLCLFLTIVATHALSAQSRRASRAKPRTAPVAVAPYELVSPAIAAGQQGAAQYPAEGDTHVPAYVLHGGRPGPTVAFLFHGFSDEPSFQEAVKTAFGALPLASMQGTVLALSFPARTICDGVKPCPTADGVWKSLAPAILTQSRFVVDVHQGARGAANAPFAFVYLPHEDRRLATYVNAMARASLIPNILELREAELAGAGLSAEALQHLAPQSLEVSHPAISVEAPLLSSTAGVSTLKGLANLLDHLKMTSGGVSWQNAVKEHSLTSLAGDFFAPAP